MSATIKDIYNSGFLLFQDLIPKNLTIKFPSTTSNTTYRNKIFLFDEIVASKLSEDRIKNDDSNYTEEAMEIKILNEIIQSTTDKTNTVYAPLGGYKQQNAKVIYKNKNFVIKKEILNEFDASITLICDTKN